MVLHYGNALMYIWSFAKRAILKKADYFPEYPGISEGAPGDRHAVATGLVKHLLD